MAEKMSGGEGTRRGSDVGEMSVEDLFSGKYHSGNCPVRDLSAYLRNNVSILHPIILTCNSIFLKYISRLVQLLMKPLKEIFIFLRISNPNTQKLAYIQQNNDQYRKFSKERHSVKFSVKKNMFKGNNKNFKTTSKICLRFGE